MRKSIWNESINLPEFGHLEGDLKTDVLIVGGGLCGVLCAHFLHEAGIDYALVEGSRIASGTTGNTTAKLTSQHGLIYSKLIKNQGQEAAEKYLEANEKAIQAFQTLCEGIDCDFEKCDAYTYSMSNRDKIEEEVKAANALGLDAEFVENTELPFKTKGAVKFKNQARFNPLKFIAHISKNLNIYENTFVKELTPTEAIVNNGRIRYKKLIVATHFPFVNKHGSYFLKLFQHRSYVSAYENAGKIEGMYVDEDKTGMSFRSYGNYLFIGGSGHRTGKKSGAWDEIDAFAKRYYPGSKLCFSWAAQDCMSLDGVPYIGHYSKNTSEMFVATGFNKWGMTSSMVAAMILTDMVQEKKNDFAEVFSPCRSIWRPQLFVNGFEAGVNLLVPTTKRCPHLGCALKWNKAEHTWDCPCHGSRFSEDGKLIDNPSTGDLPHRKY